MVHLGKQRRLLEEHKEAKLSPGTQTATPGSEGIKTLAGYNQLQNLCSRSHNLAFQDIRKLNSLYSLLHHVLRGVLSHVLGNFASMFLAPTILFISPANTHGLTNKTVSTFQSSAFKTTMKMHTSPLTFSRTCTEIFSLCGITKRKKRYHICISQQCIDTSYYDFSPTSYSWCFFHLSRF